MLFCHFYIAYVLEIGLKLISINYICMSIIKRINKRKPNGQPRMENPETWAQDTELR